MVQFISNGETPNKVLVISRRTIRRRRKCILVTVVTNFLYRGTPIAPWIHL